MNGAPAEQLRAATYLTLLLGIVGLIFANRALGAPPLAAFRRLSRAMIIVPVTVGTGIAGVFFTPFGRTTFGLGVLDRDGLILSGRAVVGAFLGMLLLKARLTALASRSAG
ncbi:hypothetical protein OU426_09740 [Frigidibacter sp. RF13]|nr:hypothetical protein [Frigidibacter sp. RF13]